MALLSGSLACSVLLAAVTAQSGAAPRALRNAVTPAPEPAPAGDVRARVETYLESKEAPVRPEQWRALGPEGAKVLEEIARDGKKLPTRRARALAALVIVGSPRASRLMVDLAQRENERAVVRMSAIKGAAVLLDPAGLLAAVKPVLEGARDLHVRSTAATVLVRKNPQGACPLVRAQTAREKLDLRPAFDRALQACDSAALRPPAQ